MEDREDLPEPEEVATDAVSELEGGGRVEPGSGPAGERERGQGVTTGGSGEPKRRIEAPEGWVIAPLGECVDILDNMRIPVNADDRKDRQGDVPYYGATGQVGWINDFIFDEELVLLGEDGAPFLDKSKPISYIIQGKSWVNNHAHVLRAKKGITLNRFLKHALDANDYLDHVTGTTRLKLTQGLCEEFRYPCRP